MKESLIKRTFNSPVWKHILTVLGVIAVIDWIIFPALTAANTIYNISGFVALLVTMVFVFYYVKDALTVKKPKTKKK